MRLRNECAQHVIQYFVVLNDKVCPFKIPLIARRYLVLVFRSGRYYYFLQRDLYCLLIKHQRGMICFKALDVEQDHEMKHQTPLFKLLKLAYSTPDIEPGVKGYIGHLEVDVQAFKHSFLAMRELVRNRIKVYYLQRRHRDIFFHEFNDLISKDFGYNPERIVGKSRTLHSLGSNLDDPRVFHCVEVAGMDQYAYCPHVFNIKTKDLRIHLDNIALYDTLPPMPHLETMLCHINPIGLYDFSIARSHYEQLAERLTDSAPNFFALNLSMSCTINSNSLENGEKAFIRAVSSVELAVDGLMKHIPHVNLKICKVSLCLPANAREELPERVESTVIDEDESLGVDVYDMFNPDVFAHFQRITCWHRNEVGMPNRVDMEHLDFRFFFEDDIFGENRLDERIDPQNGYHFWIDEEDTIWMTYMQDER